MANNINQLPVEPRKPKKHRKHTHASAVLPKRPKRPLTGYSMFLQDFFHQRSGTTTKDAMREAGAQWKELNADQKLQFKSMCTDDKVRFDSEMVLWKEQKKFIKRPPSSYALHLKDFWNTERNSGRNIVEMSKCASEHWKTMTQEHKSLYQGRHDILLSQHKENMVQLISGNVIVTNDGVLQIVPPRNENVDTSHNEDSSNV